MWLAGDLERVYQPDGFLSTLENARGRKSGSLLDSRLVINSQWVPGTLRAASMKKRILDV